MVDKNKHYTITNLTNTCAGCPSSWIGTTSDDESVSIHYRWGYLTVSISGETIDHRQLGTDIDGIMLFCDLAEKMGEQYTIPETCNHD